MNKIRVGFFSFTEITDPREHRSYNEWHQLDHMPEQFQIPGIAYGQRFVASPRCRDARVRAEPEVAPAHYVALYLMGDPAPPTLDEFAELGDRLRNLGRFHQHRHSHLSGAWQALEGWAAPRVLVGADAVPWRPGTGIYTIVEEPVDDIDAVDAGADQDHRVLARRRPGHDRDRAGAARRAPVVGRPHAAHPRRAVGGDPPLPVGLVRLRPRPSARGPARRTRWAAGT